MSNKVKMERREGQDRRDTTDRRQQDLPVAEERRMAPRPQTPRRRQIDPTTCERDYSGDEIEFMQALDAYKRTSGRMFPTCSEILEVIRDLGYRRDVGDSVEEGSPEPAAPRIPGEPASGDAQGSAL